MMDQKPKLAVLGLGTMGRAMAFTAHRSGVPLVVWNRDPAATTAFAEMGVEVARSVAEAAETADVIVTMGPMPMRSDRLPTNRVSSKDSGPGQCGPR
jgi:3-hydroxyisobutyrate dehydrogenase-like beta-hydroxyacid dehydrogenase